MQELCFSQSGALLKAWETPWDVDVVNNVFNAQQFTSGTA